MRLEIHNSSNITREKKDSKNNKYSNILMKSNREKAR